MVDRRDGGRHASHKVSYSGSSRYTGSMGAKHGKTSTPKGAHSRSSTDLRVGRSSGSTRPNTNSNGYGRVNSPLQSSSQDTIYRDHSRYKNQTAQSRKKLWRVVLFVSIAVLICSLIALGVIAYQYISQQRAYESLGQYTSLSDDDTVALSDLSVDWDALQEINPDIVAWIYIPDTSINYPVVQGDDNEEYLHTAFDGSTGWLASAGTIFLDCNNSSDFTDRNSAIYGHHMNDGSMFAALADWQSDDEFNAHRDIYLLTPEGNYRLKSFSLIITTGTDQIVQTSFSDDEDYESYIQDKLDRSVASQEGDVLSIDDIQQSVMLATCEYSQSDGRAVLFAAIVETTVADNPYLEATDEGTTGISSDGDVVLDREYEEAA